MGMTEYQVETVTGTPICKFEDRAAADRFRAGRADRKVPTKLFKIIITKEEIRDGNETH